MTHITATLYDSTNIRLDFAFDKETNAKIKTIPGWVFDIGGKFWTVPVRSLDALIATFGDRMSISLDVLDAKEVDECNRVRVFVNNLHAAGISLNAIDGRVMGSGGAYCADPWQRAIDARADTIKLLGLQNSQAPVTVPMGDVTYAYAPVDGDTLRQAQMLLTGMHNAVANQYAEEGKRKGQKGRRYAKTK